MNLAQKIAAATTLLALAVLIAVGAHGRWDFTYGRYQDPVKIYYDGAAVLLAGAAATLLLGTRRKTQ
jgi:hypothetical protein